MDTQDFSVTVRETWESIERAIDELALDGVESYPSDEGMRLMFDDASFIALTALEGEQRISMQWGQASLPFYYDTVEEHWYAQTDERHLLTVLSEAISEKLSTAVTLPDRL